MITAEIKINGVLIGHVYAHRVESRILPRGNSYIWDYYRPGERLITGSAIHKHEEGAETLLAKILKAAVGEKVAS